MKLFINTTLTLFLFYFSVNSPLNAQVVAENLGDFGISQVRWIPVNPSSFESRGAKSFLFEDGVYANVFLKEGQTIDYKRIRYDLAGQMMHFFVDGDIKAIHRNGIESFLVFDASSSQPRVFRNTSNFPKTDFQHGFFEVLVDGSTKLLRGYYVKLEPVSTLITLGGSNPNTGEFEIIPMLYVQKNQELIKLPVNKKTFLALFDQHQVLMADFMKANHLKHKRANDLILIINHFNNLD